MSGVQVTAAQLRDIVAEEISATIDLHRASRMVTDEEDYLPPVGPPTDDEVNDFLVHNPLLDKEIVDQLIDPGFLGFSAIQAMVTPEWIEDFKQQLRTWAENNSWLAADLPWLYVTNEYKPSETFLWTPRDTFQPSWISNAPACLLVARDLLAQGKLLSEMDWRDFEELIGALLESDGWTVEVAQPSRDGGFDVVASRTDNHIGLVKSLWQAKKYGPSKRVRLHEVRELSAVREEQKATKALIVTTSRLTRDALAWVKRDVYRLSYMEHDQIKKWVEGVI